MMWEVGDCGRLAWGLLIYVARTPHCAPEVRCG